MTLRTRWVRVSVRQLNESEDTDWHVPDQSWSHVRYQRVKGLVPLSGDEVLRLSRQGYEADWRATARRQPAIQDGWLLVTLDSDGDPETWLEVAKALPRGRWTELLLKEHMELQS